MEVDESLFKGLAALFSGGFALVILASGWRRPSRLALATFLLLISGNQWAETLRALSEDHAQQLFWWRIATVLAALDPVALYYFASLHPERNRLNATLPVGLVMGAGAALALTAPFTLSTRGPGAISGPVLLLDLYTLVIYATVMAWSVRRMALAPEEPSVQYLAPALAIAAFPRFGAAGLAILHMLFRGSELPITAHYLAQIAIFLSGILIGTFVLLLAARSICTSRALVTTWAAGTAVTLLLTAQPVLAAALQQPGYLEPIGRLGASIRWLSFGVLVSVAVLRHNLLDLGLAGRRRAARMFLGMAFLTAAAGLAQMLARVSGHGALQWGVAELALIGTALVFSQGFQRLVDRTAERLYGVPVPGDPAARLEAYRLAAAQATADDGTAQQRLARLRDDLGIEPAVARALEQAAEATRRGPVEVGDVVGGRYKLRALLGSGGNGRVFLARDATLERDVVVKELAAADQTHVAADEARLAGLLTHPHVVAVHDVVLRRDRCLVVTEHLSGGSLAEHVARAGPVRGAEAERLLEDVLDGLAHVHAHGIVHRDLKPSNVLLTREGRAKIADFGIARLGRTEDVTRVPGAPPAGTPAFMAPEQARGEVATPASDVYAFALVARACALVPPEWEPLLKKAMEADPARRWRDAGEILEAKRALPRRTLHVQ